MYHIFTHNDNSRSLSFTYNRTSHNHIHILLPFERSLCPLPQPQPPPLPPSLLARRSVNITHHCLLRRRHHHQPPGRAQNLCVTCNLQLQLQLQLHFTDISSSLAPELPTPAATRRHHWRLAVGRAPFPSSSRRKIARSSSLRRAAPLPSPPPPPPAEVRTSNHDLHDSAPTTQRRHPSSFAPVHSPVFLYMA